MHESFIRNSIDGPVAGTRIGGPRQPGMELWVRTELYAYTAYLMVIQGGLNASKTSGGDVRTGKDEMRRGKATYRLVDETMFATGGADAEEANNLAYDHAHSAQRSRLLNLCLRGWRIELSGPRDASRVSRAAFLDSL